MEDKIGGVHSLQDEIDDMVKEYGEDSCVGLKGFKESFTRLEDVLDDTTSHIEKVDRSLSEIEQDIAEIKRMLKKQDK